MEERKMKTIIIILKNIFMPFSAFTFLFLGLLASFCSGIVEWYVLREILKIADLGINADVWTALIVLILEGSKLTLHFYEYLFSKEAVDIEEFDVKKQRKFISFIKKMLIILSFACNVICIMNILYNNSEEKINQYVASVNKECDKKFEEKVNVANDNFQKQLKVESKAYSDQKKQLDDLNKQKKKLTKAFTDEMYITKRKDLEKQIDAVNKDYLALQKEYNGNVEEIRGELQIKLNAELADIEQKYGQNGTERANKEDKAVMKRGDNAYISMFLTAFTQTFFHRDYTRMMYLGACLVITCIISVLLEACIGISQFLLTIKVETFTTLLGEIPKVDLKNRKIVRVSIWLLFSALFSTAIYLISAILMSLKPNTNQILSAVCTYAITVVLMNVLILPLPQGERSELNQLDEKNQKLKNFGVKLRDVIFEWSVPAILSFICYIFLGFLFKGKFMYQDMSAFAIAVGGCFANFVKYQECDFKGV